MIRSDARAIPLKDESVQCVVTSPPYWGLRDYGLATWEGGDTGCQHTASSQVQDTKSPGAIVSGVRPGDGGVCRKCGAIRHDKGIGLESTPEEWVSNMVAVFREVRRVLRKAGTCWVNVGDAYAHNGASGGESPDGPRRPRANVALAQKDYRVPPGLKPKDLIGLPWRLAFALQADGWWLRADIIWAKPNPMPESVTDRPTKAHEYVFLLTKSANYYWDQEAVREPHVRLWGENNGGSISTGRMVAAGGAMGDMSSHPKGYPLPHPSGRNLRSVWTIPTQPYPGAHFATFPERLVEPCIKAGTSAKGCCPKCGAPWRKIVLRDKVESDRVARGKALTSPRHDGNAWNENNGRGFIPINFTSFGWTPTCSCGIEETRPCVVLDPFGGSGTVYRVATRLGRQAVHCDLAYHGLAKDTRMRNIQKQFAF